MKEKKNAVFPTLCTKNQKRSLDKLQIDNLVDYTVYKYKE